MDQVARENLLFFLTIANLVAGAVSIALAIVASQAIREMRRMEQDQAAKKKPSTELVPWKQRPQAITFDTTTRDIRKNPIRRSELADAQRRLVNDLW